MPEKRIITNATEAAVMRPRMVDPRRIRQIVLIATQDQSRVQGFKTEAVFVVSAWSAVNRDCYAEFKQLSEPPLTIHVGAGDGLEGLVPLANSHAKSLLSGLTFPARAHLQFQTIRNYPAGRSGPAIFSLLTLCEDDGSRNGQVINNGKDTVVPATDAAGNSLIEFQIEPDSSPAPDQNLSAHLARNEQMWGIWTSLGVSEGTHLKVDFQFYATREKSARLLEELLKTKGMTVTVQSKRMLVLLKGWEISASESAWWTLDRVQWRTRELYEDAARLDVSLEGMGAAIGGPAR